MRARDPGWWRWRCNRVGGVQQERCESGVVFRHTTTQGLQRGEFVHVRRGAGCEQLFQLVPPARGCEECDLGVGVLIRPKRGVESDPPLATGELLRWGLRLEFRA